MRKSISKCIKPIFFYDLPFLVQKEKIGKEKKIKWKRKDLRGDLLIAQSLYK